MVVHDEVIHRSMRLSTIRSWWCLPRWLTLGVACVSQVRMVVGDSQEYARVSQVHMVVHDETRRFPCGRPGCAHAAFTKSDLLK